MPAILRVWQELDAEQAVLYARSLKSLRETDLEHGGWNSTVPCHTVLRECLKTLWILREIWLVVCGYVIEPVVCVGVQCRKTWCFYDKFWLRRSFLIQRCSKFDVSHPGFGPLIDTGIPRNNGINMPKTQGEKECSKFRVPNAGRTPVCQKKDLFVTVLLLEDTPAVLSLGKLCQDHRYTYHWTSGQKPRLIKNGSNINCNTANYVPFVVLGLSTSSSTSSSPTSPTSLSQETVTPTEHPTSTRSEIMSEEVRGIPSQEPAETENPNKWQRGCFRKLVAWSARKAAGVQGQPGRCKCSWTPRRFQFFSWVTFRAASKSGIG